MVESANPGEEAVLAAFVTRQLRDVVPEARR